MIDVIDALWLVADTSVIFVRSVCDNASTSPSQLGIFSFQLLHDSLCLFHLLYQPFKENKRGSQSIQIGQQNNYYGMDYQNTKALCLDLIKNELDIYKDEAEKIARERDEHFLATFFNQLHEEKFDDETIFNEFKNPDMQ